MIRPLREDDLAAYVDLRRRSLLEAPLAFAASPDDDFAATADALRSQLASPDRWLLLGAFDGQSLVGAVGVIRNTRRKSAHKAFVWGMYVIPSHRRHGLGSRLLDAAIDAARTMGAEWLQLGVSTAMDAARRLYERKGFVQWGVERDAVRDDGASADEVHMALRL
ncbi:MAG TPA: GNAT family N-acetyltransferase [Thermoanaerobaculia bacterium]|jgi:GNAT superfamily N-acetyltransferase